MKVLKKLLCLMLMIRGLAGLSQECPEPISPAPGQSDVSVTATISWEEVPGVGDTETGLLGYQIALGTNPGGDDILQPRSTGTTPSYTPPCGLPDDTEIFVTLSLLFSNRPAIQCEPYSFTTEDITVAPECTSLTLRADGAENVPVQTSLQWDCSLYATGYALSVGTSPGSEDILPTQTLGADQLFYDLPGELEPLTTYYVQLIPFNENGAASCKTQSFTTGAPEPLPECPVRMISPVDGAQNVELDVTLTWEAVENAADYLVSVATTPTFDAVSSVMSNFRVSTNSTGFADLLEPNTLYYIRIIPRNSERQEAQGCTLVETFSTILGCGPYPGPDGTLVDLRPPITFPEVLGSCEGENELEVTAGDPADGYRWYQIAQQGRETLLGTGPTIELPGEGEYRLEIFNLLPDPENPSFECASSQVFTVTQSEPPVIEGVDVTLGAGEISIEVRVSGQGDYEYALDNPEGPYQDSNRFTGLPLQNYVVYVRDRNGCGISEVLVEPDLTADGFPKFFTPNGDNINDRWQYIPPLSGENTIRELYIFDRYGKLLKQVDPLEGWDGSFNGQPMPSSDYWYRAVDTENKVFQGHFSLKR